MLKEAIEKIEAMAARPFIATVGGLDYMIAPDGAYIQIKEDIEAPDTLRLSSLNAVVHMITNEGVKMAGNVDSPIFVSVPTHDKVEVYCSPREEERYDRMILYVAHATDIPGWGDAVKLPFDQAAVALQTRFQAGGDQDYTLRLLSMITTGAKVTYNNTGVATTVVTQKGVALQENSTIKPLVRLRPYRTFQEVNQPEGLFLIRIDEHGITFTEADGGMWKLEARHTVADYLRSRLDDELEGKDHPKIVVML